MLGKKRGFTMIEVALFLAITGLLFAGVTVGVQNSIFQQRYNDSVQSFAEFLRTAYAETTNVQGVGNGRSERAIYGKLITFGETGDFVKDDDGGGSGQAIFMYDVVGKIGDIDSGNSLEALKALGANVAEADVDDGKVKIAGMAEKYTPKWGAAIEKACGVSECTNENFKGMVLIVRHPRSGVTSTFVKIGNPVEINNYVNGGNLPVINWGEFEVVGVDGVNFCVNPIAGETRDNRRDVKIVKGARNGSGVEVVADEGENNRCVKK